MKNRGQPHFRLTLPTGTELWAATVNGVTAVPTLDGNTHLIPLPQRADPSAVNVVELKLASRSEVQERVSVAAPIVRRVLDPDHKHAHWTEFPSAGHFPAMEQPALLAGDIAAFFRGLRG